MSGIMQSFYQNVQPFDYKLPVIYNLDFDAAYFRTAPLGSSSNTSNLTRTARESSIYFGGDQNTGTDSSWISNTTSDMSVSADFTFETFVNSFLPYGLQPGNYSTAIQGWPVTPITATGLTITGNLATLTFATRAYPPYAVNTQIQLRGFLPNTTNSGTIVNADTFTGLPKYTVLSCTTSSLTFVISGTGYIATTLGTFTGFSATYNRFNIFTIGSEADANRIVFYMSAGTLFYQIGANAAVNLGTNCLAGILGGIWRHLVIERTSTTLSVFVDAGLISQLQLSGTVGGNTGFYIGNGNSLGSTGQQASWTYLNNIRFVKGQAVYSAPGFTVPTGPLNAVQGNNPYGGSGTVAITAGQTNLLINNSPEMKLDASLTGIADSSSYNNTLTLNGTAPPVWQAVAPYSFSNTNNYRISKATYVNNIIYENRGTINWQSGNGGYFSMTGLSANEGTNQSIRFPTYLGPVATDPAGFTLFYVYRLPVTMAGRLINIGNINQTNDVALATYNGLPNMFFFGQGNNPSGNPNVWTFNWITGTYISPKGWTLNFYSATSAAPTGTYQASYNLGTSANSYDTLFDQGPKLWGKGDGQENLSGDIGFFKVANRPFSLSEIGSEWLLYKTRFGY